MKRLSLDDILECASSKGYTHPEMIRTILLNLSNTTMSEILNAGNGLSGDDFDFFNNNFAIPPEKLADLPLGVFYDMTEYAYMIREEEVIGMMSLRSELLPVILLTAERTLPSVKMFLQISVPKLFETLIHDSQNFPEHVSTLKFNLRAIGNTYRDLTGTTVNEETTVGEVITVITKVQREQSSHDCPFPFSRRVITASQLVDDNILFAHSNLQNRELKDTVQHLSQSFLGDDPDALTRYVYALRKES